MRTEDEIGAFVVDAAIRVHKGLGPGLLETIYEVVLHHELFSDGLSVERQVLVPLSYRGLQFDEAFRADLMIERKVILELESVEVVSSVHRKQLLSYLRLTGLKLGFLLNFGHELMKDGIVRVVNGLERSGERQG